MEKLRFNAKYNFALDDLAAIEGEGKKVKVGSKNLDIDALAAVEGGKPFVKVGNKDISLEGIYESLQPEPEPEPEQSNDEIWYEAEQMAALFESGKTYGQDGELSIVSHTFDNGKGIIKFDGNVVALSDDEGNTGIFENETNIKKLMFPATLQRLGGYAMDDMDALEEANFENIVSFGECAVGFIPTLKSVTIGANCNHIGTEAFNGCSGLETIYVMATVPPEFDEDYVDTFAESECPIYVPGDSIEAYTEAYGWSDYADRIQPII